MHQYGAATNIGNVRENNEDSYVCDLDKELWIVADGMGGLGFGEVASAITTYTVTRLIREGHGVNHAIEVAHRRIKEYAESDGMGTNMGTTIVLLLSQGSLYNIFWVGDSRAYLFHEGSLRQVTVDHSLVQSLIDQGELTREQARSDPRKNAVTRALGVQELETVRADSISDKWLPGQKVLLCSDGLTDCVSNDEIETILQEEGTDQEKVDRLIQKALDQGGPDNVTVVLVSAPLSVRRADSDTESRYGSHGSDDTQIPEDDSDSHRNNTPRNYAAVQSSEQAALPQDAGPERLADAGKQTTDHAAQMPPWKTGLLGIAAVVTLMVFAYMNASTSPDEEPLFSSFEAALDAPIAPGTESAAQLMHRPLPAFDLPEPGARIQVGIFSRLQGAETRQQELSRIGLISWIRKRPTENGTLYVVLLGPYHDRQRHESVTARLDANNLDYVRLPHQDNQRASPIGKRGHNL